MLKMDTYMCSQMCPNVSTMVHWITCKQRDTKLYHFTNGGMTDYLDYVNAFFVVLALLKFMIA